MSPTAPSTDLTPDCGLVLAFRPARISATGTSAVALRAAVALTALIALAPDAAQTKAPGPELAAQLQEQVVLVNYTTIKGNGSGVILAPDRVVTNCHVAENAATENTQLQVISHAGAAPLPAALIARDPEHDLCLLAIDGPTRLPTGGITQIAETAVQTGEPVHTAGAPQGHIDIVSTGIVSARQRLHAFPEDAQAWVASKFELCRTSELDAARYVVTDAHFSAGSSGGGLFNANAELVGITTFAYHSRIKSEDQFAVRFVIPAAHVQALLEMDPDKELLAVVSFFAAAGRYQHAFAASDRIGTSTRKARARVAIAKAQLSAGRGPTAINTLRSARAIADTIEDPGDRAKRLKDVAEALADAKAFGDANQVAATIAVPKAQSQAYRSIARTQADLGHFEAAHRAVRNIRDPKTRARTSDYTVREQVRALVKADDPGRARQAANQIQDDVRRVAELRRVARAYDRLDQWKAANRIHTEAIKQAHKIVDLTDRVGALMDIANDQAETNYPADPRPTVEAAIETAEQIEDDAKRDEVRGDIVSMLTDMPRLISIQADVANRISDAHARDEAFRIMAKMLAERGQFDAAQAWAEAIVNPSIQGDAEHSIVGRLLTQEEWVRATNVAAGIEHGPSRAAAHYDIVEAQTDEGQLFAARRAADTIDDAVTAAEAYLHISSEAVHTDDVRPDLVSELLEITERRIQEIADADDRAKRLANLVAVYLEAARDSQALDTLLALSSTRHFARALRLAAEGYAERSSLESLERLERLESLEKAEKFALLIPQCAEKERRRAIKSLERAHANH